MKTVTIRRRGDIVKIDAPLDKDMVVDQSALHEGILSIGEYGQSGIKIVAMREWDEAWFGAENFGYIIKEESF